MKTKEMLKMSMMIKLWKMTKKCGYVEKVGNSQFIHPTIFEIPDEWYNKD